MKCLTLEDVKDILDRSAFAELIGATEDQYLDFKTAPYHFDGEKGKRDLAADVSAFANAAGGIIVIGVETEKHEAVPRDVAKALHLFRIERMNEYQYYGVIENWVTPRPEGVEVRWYPPAGDSDEGLAAILVPPQGEEQKPFITKKALVDESGKNCGRVCRNLRARSRRCSAFHAGRDPTPFARWGRFNTLFDQAEPLTERVDRMVEGLETPARRSVQPARADHVGVARNRRGEAVRDADLNEHPTYSLLAVPSESVNVPELFGGSERPLVHLLDNPPELRHAGFDLTVGVATRILRGDLRRAISGNKLLELWRDGVLISVAYAGGALCHGTRTADEPLVLNVLALAETMYLFADLTTQIAQHLNPSPQDFNYVLALQRMESEGKRAILTAGSRRERHSAMLSNIRTAPGLDMERRMTFKADTDPRLVAYSLRRELYAWFGLDEDSIPYVTMIGDQPGTDPDKIIEDGLGP